MKNLYLLIVVILGFFIFGYVYETELKSSYTYKVTDLQQEKDKIKLRPGKIIRLKFHDSYSNIDSVCELRIPENYNINNTSPIFVWFSPSGGSYKIKDVPPLVDFKNYIVVALPYKDGIFPRIAIKEGDINQLWDYDKPMLMFIRTIIPNISKDKRLVGGFSSGAHMVASGLDRDWDGFTNFFTGYIIHEGGYAPDMQYKGIKPTHKVLLTYGEKSNNYGKLVGEMMTQFHKNVTVYSVPNTAHELNTQTMNTIQSWIKNDYER